jgi:hypothetical protein
VTAKPMTEQLDLSQVQPAMRRTVALVRSMGLETTDSGDGVTNVLAGMEHALDVAHVHCVVDPEDMIERSRELLCVVTDHVESLEGVHIQATYSPLDGVATLLLLGVSDARLKP